MPNMHSEFIEHLIQLRKRIIYILMVFIVSLIILYPFSKQIFNLIANPLLAYLPKSSGFIATDILSPFFVPLKLTAISAFILTIPHTIYQIWQYISPGLYKTEKKLILFISIGSISLFTAGCFFCYYIALPLLFKFINQIKFDNINMLTDINLYLDFILSLLFVFGISFQMPLIVALSVRFKLASAYKLKKLRPYVLIGCFIIGAIVTPPDILSQIILALPLYMLYELGLIISNKL